MLKFGKIIEDFINSNWNNSNHKEQNFQGRLYSYLLPLEQLGYCVEMESNVSDEHLKDVIPVDEAEVQSLCKKEIDILVYKRLGDVVAERYLAELKWIYHKDGPWNVTDQLADFIQDARFCRQMASAKFGSFDEACSVVVYDFDNNKNVVNYSPKQNVEIKNSFVGGCYETKLDNLCTLVVDDDCRVNFRWKRLGESVQKNATDYRYYSVSFTNKWSIGKYLAEMVEAKYGFRPEKCYSLVTMSSWWNNLPPVFPADTSELLNGFLSICNDIDDDIIQ